MLSNILEHSLDPIQISPDQFLDCAQALIHTIIFHRTVDIQTDPKIILLSGIDISFATSESSENIENIKKRLLPMQDYVFTGINEVWIILSLSYSTSKRGWFRDSQTSQIWERWAINFTFGTLTAKEMRDTLLHAITQITLKSNNTEIPKRNDENSTFQYNLNLPIDKDWESSKEILKLFQKMVKTPTNMF